MASDLHEPHHIEGLPTVLPMSTRSPIMICFVIPYYMSNNVVGLYGQGGPARATDGSPVLDSL